MGHNNTRHVTMVILAIVVSLFNAGTAAAAQLDEAFGEDGVVTLVDELGSTAYASAQLGDGMLAVGGSRADFSPWLSLVAADGASITSVDLSAFDGVLSSVVAITELGDDLLILATDAPDVDTCDWVLVKLTRTGEPDASFGATGPGFTRFPSCFAGVVVELGVFGQRILAVGSMPESDADEAGYQITSFSLDGHDLERHGTFIAAAEVVGIGVYGPPGAELLIRDQGGDELLTGPLTDLDNVSAHLDREPGTLLSSPAPGPTTAVMVESTGRAARWLVIADTDGGLTKVPITGTPSTPSLYTFETGLLRTGAVAAVSVPAGEETAFLFDLIGNDGKHIDRVADWEDGVFGPSQSPAGLLVDHHAGTLTIVAHNDVFGLPDTPVSLVRFLTDESGRFLDDDASIHEADIEAIADTSVTRGCDPPANTDYCPSAVVSRGQMAAFVVRAVGLPPVASSPFDDASDSEFEADIAALAAAGITRGCDPPENTRFCPDQPVTRAQMATFLVRAFDLEPAGESPFSDTAGSMHEPDIAALAAAGITKGCTADRFCPGDPVTRAQMASFLIRALRS